MKQTELKTYLSILASKVKTSPYKEVEITGKEIKVRGEKGNANILFVFTCETKGDGVYSPEALSLLCLDINADISAYRIRDAEGWQVAQFQVYDTWYLNKEWLNCLTEAVKYVSKDEFRQSLNRVHFTHGDIMATDGYRAYLHWTGQVSTNGSLTPSTIAIVKKCYKYGEWHIEFGKTPFSDNTQRVYNEVFSVYDKGVELDTVPKMRQLFGERDLDTDTEVDFPYQALKLLRLNKNDSKVELNIDPLGNSGDPLQIILEGQVLPLRAKYKRVSRKYNKGQKDVKVLMPRSDGSCLICFDLDYLNCFPTDKAGNIKLTFKTGWTNPTQNGLKSIILVV